MAADGIAPKSRPAAAILLLWLAAVIAGCGLMEPKLPRKIALLAPFEGRYRAIGYNALYAARLAFIDAAPTDWQLLPVDDGGAHDSAVARVKALNMDPAVAAIIALGPMATHASAQSANDKPLILLGNWGHDIADAQSLYVANARLAQAKTSGDLMLLSQARKLDNDLRPPTFSSSGALPDANFRERYLASAQYAPPPNLLATLTYDVFRLALDALAAGEAISAAQYSGINGLIRFENGYWADAPINRYRIVGEGLVTLED